MSYNVKFTYQNLSMMDRIKVMNSTNPSYARLQALLLKDFVKRICLIFLKDTNNMVGSKLVVVSHNSLKFLSWVFTKFLQNNSLSIFFLGINYTPFKQDYGAIFLFLFFFIFSHLFLFIPSLLHTNYLFAGQLF